MTGKASPGFNISVLRSLYFHHYGVFGFVVD